MRGQIENRARKRQIIDFSGLLFGKITPTDIDGMIEYHGKAFVYYEMKYLGTDIKRGQRIALEQSVISHNKAGRRAVAIVLTHSVDDCKEDIQAEKCLVREYFFRPQKGWEKPKQAETALSLTQKFLNWVDML